MKIGESVPTNHAGSKAQGTDEDNPGEGLYTISNLMRQVCLGRNFNAYIRIQQRKDFSKC
jgi:hypothetical protein